ncbi:MAG TPA: YbgC/FadM family acyl-CoA thioesterase [Rubrivivax sp.]|nr:YbgC/FadM family acyl-CoA thioesterase [Rubrivivax sp.]
MSLKRSDFRFRERLRVRWAEVDMQKIVFNGHYLMYFDTAVAGYWRALALPYHDSMERLQGDLFVRKATLEYEGSARYDEQLEVGIRCARIGTSSMRLDAAVFRGEQRLVHGELVYVFADPATQTSRPVPAALREVLEGFEAGRPSVELRSGDWPTLGADARAIRHAVFAEEQGIAADLVCDDADATALHVVAFNHLGMAVAGGRLLQAAPGVAQVGRMATLASVRGAGLGRAVLDELLRAARERGDREVMLNAQTIAAAFYRHAGFTVRGTEFMAAGVPHLEMRRSL